jgi:hypothetical protein
MKELCTNCNQFTEMWQQINGGPIHCHDGCFSTTGRDKRTTDGKPAWRRVGNLAPWHPLRLLDRLVA